MLLIQISEYVNDLVGVNRPVGFFAGCGAVELVLIGGVVGRTVPMGNHD